MYWNIAIVCLARSWSVVMSASAPTRACATPPPLPKLATSPVMFRGASVLTAAAAVGIGALGLVPLPLPSCDSTSEVLPGLRPDDLPDVSLPEPEPWLPDCLSSNGIEASVAVKSWFALYALDARKFPAARRFDHEGYAVASGCAHEEIAKRKDPHTGGA